MCRFYHGNVQLATILFSNWYMDANRIAWICNCLKSWSGARVHSGQDLDHQHTPGEAVQLGTVVRRLLQGLWGHVDKCAWAQGQRSDARIDLLKLGHAKIGDFCSIPGNQQYVIAGQITMNQPVAVEVDQRDGYVMADIHLEVVREGTATAVQESGQTFITELHEKNQVASGRFVPCTEVLDNVGVLDGAEKATLLLELGQQRGRTGVTEVKQRRVHDFGCTQEVVARGLTHCPVGSFTERFVLTELYTFETKLLLAVRHSCIQD